MLWRNLRKNLKWDNLRNSGQDEKRASRPVWKSRFWVGRFIRHHLLLLFIKLYLLLYSGETQNEWRNRKLVGPVLSMSGHPEKHRDDRPRHLLLRTHGLVSISTTFLRAQKHFQKARPFYTKKSFGNSRGHKSLYDFVTNTSKYNLQQNNRAYQF